MASLSNYRLAPRTVNESRRAVRVVRTVRCGGRLVFVAVVVVVLHQRRGSNERGTDVSTLQVIYTT